ncbi:MAG: hypothetical protein ABW123_12230 [Cystobacter sp.]
MPRAKTKPAKNFSRIKVNSNSQYYTLADLPVVYHGMADDVEVRSNGNVRWGWRQWILLAPFLHRHIQKWGRKDLATNLDKWQKLLKFPAHITRRTSSAFAPSAQMDPVKLCAFIMVMPPRTEAAPYTGREKPAKAVQEAAPVEAPAPAPAAAPEVQELPNTEIQATAPSAPPPVLGGLTKADLAEIFATFKPTPAQSMQGFMATPIGVFAAPLRALLAEVLRDVVKPNADFIRDIVKDAAREAVIEAVGAPTPAPAPAPPMTVQEAQTLTPEEAAQAIIQSIEAMPKPSEILALLQRNADKADGVEPEPEDHTPRHGKRVQGATLEDKLANAASAIGVEAHKRESVVCVGLNMHVQQEVMKYYGKGYRFTFLNRDDFTQADHLPASTDAVLLCRKKLPTQLLQATRRYNIPTESIANTSQAVLWALSKVFPDHHAKGLSHAHH